MKSSIMPPLYQQACSTILKLTYQILIQVRQGSTQTTCLTVLPFSGRATTELAGGRCRKMERMKGHIRFYRYDPRDDHYCLLPVQESPLKG